MSTKVSSFKRYSQDHFVPDVSEDTNAQRRLHGQLEQIDYTAYVFAAGPVHVLPKLTSLGTHRQRLWLDILAFKDFNVLSKSDRNGERAVGNNSWV